MNILGTKIKILVVEDEIILAQDIMYRLEDVGYEVIGIAPSVDKALQLLEEKKGVDILLIDIILKGDRDGIELAKIVNKKYDIPFIFLTSHSDQSLLERAKKVKPYAYLLKPYNDRQMRVAIELALINFSNKGIKKELFKTAILNNSEHQVIQIKDSLFLKKDHHFKRVPLKEILFIKADSNYTSIYTKTERFLYSIVLRKIEEQLPHDNFLRTHRSYVVNVNSVDGFGGNMLYIKEQKIPVSRTYKDRVFKLFRTI